MNINKILALTAASLAAFGAITPAMADEPLQFGWYVEGNLGQSRTSGVTYAPGASNSNTGFGWNLNLGYKFMPYFATEIGYTSYKDTRAKIGGVTVADDSHFSYDFAGKGIVPFSDTGFEVFAKLGIAAARSHVTAPHTVSGVTVTTGTNNCTCLYFGLGGDYSFSNNLTGVLQWARARGNSGVGNLDLISIGLGYTFA